MRVLAHDAGTVTIAHSEGINQLSLPSLPDDLRNRFAFDPAAYDAWLSASRADLATTAATQRRVASETAARAARNATPPVGAAGTTTQTSPPAQVELRAEVDLRPLYSSLGLYFKNQGRRPSCSVFAVVGAVEYELARTTGLPGPLSEEFLIWAVRDLQPGIPIDDGYHFHEVVSALQLRGITTQALVPNTFGVPLRDIRPGPTALADAAMRRNVVPLWFRRDDPDLLARIVHTLNEGSPVIVGLRWPHWRTLRNNPLLRDQQPLAGGGHAVTLVGYRCPDRDPAQLVFLFRNSYGVDWGIGGCGWVTADYLAAHLLAALRITVP